MDNETFGAWRKSTRSGGADNCVEVATTPSRHVGVRDSKNPHDGVLVFDLGAWTDFVEGVRQGEFDL